MEKSTLPHVYRRKCTLANLMKGLLADSYLKGKMAGRTEPCSRLWPLKWVLYPEKVKIMKGIVNTDIPPFYNSH